MQQAMPVIAIQNVTKTYQMGRVRVEALRGVNLTVERGEMLAVMGPSGSGKSTMMNIIGCLDVPSDGRYFLEGEDVREMNDNELAGIRQGKIGFVFQTYNLLQRASALANVEMPLMYGNGHNRRARALEALEGGARTPSQAHADGALGRRAAARRHRAGAGEGPAILLADEPTGNLDTRSSDEIMAVIQGLNRNEGLTIVLVTHEMDIAQHTNRIVSFRDGLVVDDAPVAQPLLAGQHA